MKLLLASLALLGVFAANAAPAAPLLYAIDSAHTQVLFSWSHLGFSHPGASFEDVSGTLSWDAADPTKSSVTVSMPTAKIFSHVPLLDEKLRSAEFLDAEKFPTVTFASTRVARAGAGKFKVTGDLTVHGVTRPVVLDVTLNQSGPYPMLNLPALGFDATTTIRRSEFGVGDGIPMVSDALPVQITAEALEAEGFARFRAQWAAEAAEKK